MEWELSEREFEEVLRLGAPRQFQYFVERCVEAGEVWGLAVDGADWGMTKDVNDLDQAFEVISDATDTHAVRLAASDAGLSVESADIAWLPSVSVPLEDEVARKVLKLVDALEDLDDVQNVWANFDVSDEVLESV